MKLLPIPLPEAERRAQSRRIRKLLKNHSLDELLEQELAKVYSWEAVEDPVKKRLCSNTVRIFSREELKTFFANSYRAILGSDTLDS